MTDYYQFGRRIRSSETFTVRSWSFKIVVTLHMDAWIFYFILFFFYVDKFLVFVSIIYAVPIAFSLCDV